MGAPGLIERDSGTAPVGNARGGLEGECWQGKSGTEAGKGCSSREGHRAQSCGWSG